MTVADLILSIDHVDAGFSSLNATSAEALQYQPDQSSRQRQGLSQNSRAEFSKFQVSDDADEETDKGTKRQTRILCEEMASRRSKTPATQSMYWEQIAKSVAPLAYPNVIV